MKLSKILLVPFFWCSLQELAAANHVGSLSPLAEKFGVSARVPVKPTPVEDDEELFSGVRFPIMANAQQVTAVWRQTLATLTTIGLVELSKNMCSTECSNMTKNLIIPAYFVYTVGQVKTILSSRK